MIGTTDSECEVRLADALQEAPAADVAAWGLCVFADMFKYIRRRCWWNPTAFLAVVRARRVLLRFSRGESSEASDIYRSLESARMLADGAVGGGKRFKHAMFCLHSFLAVHRGHPSKSRCQ